MLRRINLEEKMRGYRKLRPPRCIDVKEVRPIELKAMRYLRNMKPNELSRIMWMTMDDMLRYESSKDEFAPQEVALKYITAMDILPNEHKKLRLLMEGKADSYETDRAIPSIIKKKVNDRDGGKCVRCNSNEKIHYHHIKRFADGGQHSVDNIELLCASCHAKEHKKEPAYYILKSMAEG